MHQYKITSARKSGLSIKATPDIGTRLQSSPTSSVSITNHGLAGRRISSGRAAANVGIYAMSLTAAAAPFARSILFRRFLGATLRCRGVSENQDLRAALDTGNRLACDAGKNLSGFALDGRHLRDGEPRRIRAVDPRSHQAVSRLNLRVRRHEAQLGQTRGA